jgi:hypothetical protein
MEGKVVTRIPTRVGVEKLEKVFGIPEEGQVITWDEIESAMGQEKRSNRFNTVLSVWRRQLLEENNVLLSAIGEGRGLIAADPQRRVEVAGKYVERSRKALSRGLFVAYNTDATRLNAGYQAKRNSIIGRANEAKLRLTALLTGQEA